MIGASSRLARQGKYTNAKGGFVSPQMGQQIGQTVKNPNAKGLTQPAQRRGMIGAAGRPYDWSDKLLMLGGALKDLDSTVGTGNDFAQAHGMVQGQRADEYARGRDAMMDERYDDQVAYSRGRDDVSDARYTDQVDYSRQRDAAEDDRYEMELKIDGKRNSLAQGNLDRNFERGVMESDRQFDLENAKFDASQSPLSGGSNTSAMDFLGPQDFQNDFWQFNGPPAGGGFMPAQFTLTQGVDQMGPLDNTRPDDQRRASGAPTGAVSGDAGEYQTYMGRAQGAGDADRLRNIQSNAETTLNTGNVRLDAMESLLKQGAPVGPLSGARATATRFGIPLMEDSELALLSQFQRQSQDYALEVGQAMKGAFSDADREFVQKSLNANMKPEEAQGVINLIRATNDRLLLHADTASKWHAMYGGLSARDEQGRDFDSAWRDFQQSNPLFERDRIPGEVGEGAGAPAGARSGMLDGRPVYEDPQTGDIRYSDTGEVAQ
ncbi:MAG: hypothetical protein AAF141_13390 [Pseudomonadota bacterium]